MFEIRHTNITARHYLSSQQKLPPWLLEQIKAAFLKGILNQSCSNHQHGSADALTLSALISATVATGKRTWQVDNYLCATAEGPLVHMMAEMEQPHFTHLPSNNFQTGERNSYFMSCSRSLSFHPTCFFLLRNAFILLPLHHPSHVTQSSDLSSHS